MNTQQSTDLTTELPELTAALDAARATLQQRLADELARADAAKAAQAQRIAESWAEPLAILRAALPEWLHPYIEQPTEQYEISHFDEGIRWHEYNPVRITVRGCNPVAAWVHNSNVIYEPMQPTLDRTDEDGYYVYDDLWQQQRNMHNIDRGERDIAVALLRARTNYLNRLDLEEEARCLNAEAAAAHLDEAIAEQAVAEPEPAAPIADPIDQALELLGKFSRGEPVTQVGGAAIERSAAAVLASTGLAVAHHLRRAADALEASQRTI